MTRWVTHRLLQIERAYTPKPDPRFPPAGEDGAGALPGLLRVARAAEELLRLWEPGGNLLPNFSDELHGNSWGKVGRVTKLREALECL